MSAVLLGVALLAVLAVVAGIVLAPARRRRSRSLYITPSRELSLRRGPIHLEREGPHE